MAALRPLLLVVVLIRLLAPAAPAYDCGDCNLDGTVTVLDALAAARHDVGLALLTGSGFDACDVDLSGTVTVLDALRVSQWAVGLAVAVDCVGGVAGLSCGTGLGGTLTAASGGDLSVPGGTRFLQVGRLPPGILSLTLELTGDPVADLDLLVGAPGTVPGSPLPGDYPIAGVPGTSTETVVLDAGSVPAIGAYGAGPVALAVTAVAAPGSFNVSVVCRMDYDVRPTALSAPATAPVGSLLRVSRTLDNQGSASTTGFYEAFYLSVDPVLEPGSDLLVGRFRVSGVPAGGTVTGDRDCTVPPGTALGTYHLFLRADSDDELVETDEGNNDLEAPATLDVIPATYDLEVTSISAPGGVARGASFAVTRTLRNNGNAVTPASTERIVLSPDPQVTAADLLLGDFPTPSLLPGEEDTTARPVTIPPSVTAGSYTLGFLADVLDDIGETQEGNNLASLPVNVFNAVASLACGAQDSGSLSVASGAPRGTFGVAGSDAFYSLSSLPAGTASVEIGLVGTGDIDLLVGAPGTQPGSSLPAGYAFARTTPGSSHTVTLNAQSSPSLASYGGGPVAIALVAFAPGTYTLSVSCQQGPDLEVTAVGAPATATAGLNVSVSRTIVNSGGTAAGAFEERLVLSTDPVIGPSDLVLGTYGGPGLIPGASSVLSRSAILPPSVQAGTYYLGIIADAAGQIAEINEQNNARAAPASTSVAGVPGAPPTITLLTVDDLPASMNGSGTYVDRGGVTRQFDTFLPRSDFQIRVEYVDNGMAGIDLSSLQLTASVGIGAGGTFHAPGQSFGDDPAWVRTASRSTLVVPASLIFPAQDNIVLTARISDNTAMVSPPVSLTVDVEDRASASLAGFEDLDPFNNVETWLLVFSRNFFDINSQGSGTLQVTSTAAGASGSGPDFHEDLVVTGLRGGEVAPGASSVTNGGRVGANAIVTRWIQEVILARLRELYQQDPNTGTPLDPRSPRVVFVLEGDPGAPNPGGFTSGGTFSMMGIGGDPAENPTGSLANGTVGLAGFDPRNPIRNNNTGLGVGVFSTNYLRFNLNAQPGSAFRATLDPLVPGRGTPVGHHSLDATVLSGSFNLLNATPTEAARYHQIADAVGSLGRALGTVAAHEIGHSCGLVANDGPPTGLFGNEYNASFAIPAYTNPAHLDLQGNNIMVAAAFAIDQAAVGAATPFFEPLSLAYLRRQLLNDEGR